MNKNNQNISDIVNSLKGEVNSGIFFNLHGSKSILEIVSVLNFLKYKIKKWGLSTIFSYKGTLFNNNTTLVIGAENRNQAVKIIITVYLEKFMEIRGKVLNEWELGQRFSIASIKEDINSNIEIGIPDNIEIELELKTHLEEILSEDFWDYLSSDIK